MALPSYVTQVDLKSDRALENIVTLEDVTNIFKRVLFWSDLTEEDTNLFQAIIDLYGGSYPITSSAGYAVFEFESTITGGDSINLNLSTSTLVLSINGTEYSYTPSSTSISFSTMISEINSTISNATASINGREILITHNSSGNGNDVDIIDDNLMNFIGGNNFLSRRVIPGVDNTINALNNLTADQKPQKLTSGKRSAKEYFRHSISNVFIPPTRRTSDIRTGVSISNGSSTPAIALRRKLNFPTNNIDNVTPASIQSIRVTTDQELAVRIYTTARGNVSDGTWNDPDGVSNTDDTSLETNIGATSFSGGEIIRGPILIGSGSTGQETLFSIGQSIELAIKNDNEIIIEIENVSASNATVSVTVDIFENFQEIEIV